MTAEAWRSGRHDAGLTQLEAAYSLDVSQPYLSQLEKGLRAASADLARKAASLYGLSPAVLPVPTSFAIHDVSADRIQQKLASLGYPGFEHIRASEASNPAEVVLSAIVKRDLDTRLVEALPWVLSRYVDLNWEWLRDGAKLNNAQNRLGYLVHLAVQAKPELLQDWGARQILFTWQAELEQARLANEGTLCRDSMPERERTWLRANRPEAAVHWSLLTSLAANQLHYANE